MSAASATRCPHHYRETGRGNFRLDGNAAAITPDIIENWNRFAVRWRLRTWSPYHMHSERLS